MLHHSAYTNDQRELPKIEKIEQEVVFFCLSDKKYKLTWSDFIKKFPRISNKGYI